MVKPTELRYKVGGQHFHFEQVWQLDGLVAASALNGKLGIVKRPTNRPGETPGRLKVKVLSQSDVVAVKPENLKAIDVDAYEALPDREKTALRMHSFTHHAIEDIDTERGGYTMRADTLGPGGVYLTHGFHAEPEPEPEQDEVRAATEPPVGTPTPVGRTHASGAPPEQPPRPSTPAPQGRDTLDRHLTGIIAHLEKREHDATTDSEREYWHGEAEWAKGKRQKYRTLANSTPPAPQEAKTKTVKAGDAGWVYPDGTERHIPAGEYDEADYLDRSFAEQLRWSDAMKGASAERDDEA
tara:strand:- start:384 stop:1274 length:891 start_codon:yes stop_codon:yes gene_type:complete